MEDNGVYSLLLEETIVISNNCWDYHVIFRWQAKFHRVLVSCLLLLVIVVFFCFYNLNVGWDYRCRRIVLWEYISLYWPNSGNFKARCSITERCWFFKVSYTNWAMYLRSHALGGGLAIYSHHGRMWISKGQRIHDPLWQQKFTATKELWLL